MVVFLLRFIYIFLLQAFFLCGWMPTTSPDNQGCLCQIIPSWSKKNKLDCVDPVLFLGGRQRHYPWLTPLSKRQSQWPRSLRLDSPHCDKNTPSARRRRKSHHNEVSLSETAAMAVWLGWADSWALREGCILTGHYLHNVHTHHTIPQNTHQQPYVLH